MSIEDDRASAVLADIERSERKILDTYQRHCSGPVVYQHFFLFGIARRALAQSAAFRQMIADRNSLVAAAIVRMQLDTVLRVYALFFVSDPEDFAKQVFSGKPINRLHAADGHLLTDKYLANQLSVRNSWVPTVYAETSGYIHFSHRHMKAAIELIDEKTGEAELCIGPGDTGKSLSYYGEMLRAFLHLNVMIPVAAEDWFDRLN